MARFQIRFYKGVTSDTGQDIGVPSVVRRRSC